MSKILRAIKDVLFGMTVHDMIRGVEHERILLNYMCMLVTIGDMLGLPIAGYYRLKMLPLWVRLMDSWKRYVLSERDIFDRL